MKIVFERDEIVSIERSNINANIDICDNDFGCSSFEIKILSDCKSIFKRLNGIIFDVELRYDDNSLIIGSFLWTHNVNEHSFFKSTGVVNYLDTSKPSNWKAFDRIKKIEKQLKKLKRDLNG